ncbi:hypothetical protein [Okeania sp. SIO3I5]|uniref:hypothetical protein n=1 Tax=Okeania sp. SIO3I5 TaxID=2607805 RepID=UPI0025EFC419|nr:hypothetical protein [Okeania sp. SIO3I5]
MTSTAARHIRHAHRLQPILETALGEKKALPERQINSVQTFIERFPGVERVIMDGTERPVQRPTDSEKHASELFGKKKASHSQTSSGSKSKQESAGIEPGTRRKAT